MFIKIPEFKKLYRGISLELVSYLKCSVLILNLPRSIWYLVVSSTGLLVSNSLRTWDIKLAAIWLIVILRTSNITRNTLRASDISLKKLYWTWVWTFDTQTPWVALVWQDNLGFLFEFQNHLPEAFRYVYMDRFRLTNRYYLEAHGASVFKKLRASSRDGLSKRKDFSIIHVSWYQFT